jgi:hypothetical protein
MSGMSLKVVSVKHNVLLPLLVVLLFSAGVARAEPLEMTREQIIELARPAVGHGYHWGHGNWTTDGTNIGTCTKTLPTGCPDCTYSGNVGTDCSGYVAKAWQVPDPTPVELDTHPYGTGAFYDSTPHWTNLPRDNSDVQRGDAFVKRGHIVLVDQRSSATKYVIYHASGCANGVRHESWTYDAAFKPIRRNLLSEVACTPESCNNNGDCNADGTCHCKAGYEGDHCERCVAGFTGYPTCVASGCSPTQGKLDCGKSFSVPFRGKANKFESYGCASEALPASELVYSFAPAGQGTATIRVSGAAVSMLLMRNECDPSTSCIAKSESELTFEYGANEPFYVAFDAASGVSGNIDVSVECETPRSTWIGDPCSSDADCDFRSLSLGGADARSAFCYRGESGSFCSMPCTRGCPDLPNAAPTACIADPANMASGMCVPQSHSLNSQCATVPGTSAKSTKKFGNGPAVQACVPGPAVTPCAGTFRGRVVDADSGVAIAGAHVAYAAAAASQMSDTDTQGAYTSAEAACGSYALQVTADGYTPGSAQFELKQGLSDVPLIKLQRAGSCTGAADVTGRVLNGLANQPVAGATLEVRAGANATSGAAVGTATAGADGSYTLAGLMSGDYTVSAIAQGFATGAQRSVKVCGGTNLTEQNIYLTPQSSGGALRFVLNWNQPDDLDLHLLLPTGEDIFFDAECHGSLDEPPYAALDVDHQLADGPETITISRFLPGRYELFVHNYSAQNEDGAGFAASGGELIVYDGANQVTNRFAVPSGDGGFFWDVLSIDGGTGSAEIPDITPIQRLNSSRPNPYDEYATTCGPG